MEGVRRDPKEDEADEWTENGLIPNTIWQTSRVKDNPSPLAVMELAQRLEIHPAIVAGRVRHEKRNFRLLSHFVGTGEVRRQLSRLCFQSTRIRLPSFSPAIDRFGRPLAAQKNRGQHAAETNWRDCHAAGPSLLCDSGPAKR